MNPYVGWALAAVFAFASWQGYGWRGLAFAVTAIAFWLLLQFNRVVRAMKNAAEAPLGSVPSAVMFQAGLRRGMTMLQVVSKTKSLGRKLGAGDDDWAWADDGGRTVSLHFEGGRLLRWAIDSPPT